METKPLKIWTKPRRIMMDRVDIDALPLLNGGKKDDENSGFQFNSSALQRTKKIQCYDNFDFLDDLLDDEAGNLFHLIFFLYREILLLSPNSWFDVKKLSVIMNKGKVNEFGSNDWSI